MVKDKDLAGDGRRIEKFPHCAMQGMRNLQIEPDRCLAGEDHGVVPGCHLLRSREVFIEESQFCRHASLFPIYLAKVYGYCLRLFSHPLAPSPVPTPW